MKQELFFIDQNGEEVEAPIFAPLLQVLLPAFMVNAEDIRISCSRSEPAVISGTYTKGGKTFPLIIQHHFHWGDVFVRVKILAGLSIAREAHQSGNIAVQFKGDAIPFSAETTENEKADTLRLKLLAQR